MANVLITGGTGYMGRALIPELLRRGHSVRALVRPGSEKKLAQGATAIPGDALDAASVRAAIGEADVLVHLVGVAHPSPAKAREFREIDLRSIEASVAARPRYLVYVSVAHPAPAMKSYIEARSEGEALIRAAGLTPPSLALGTCWVPDIGGRLRSCRSTGCSNGFRLRGTVRGVSG